MAQTKALEGTGAELERYLKQRQQQRFRLVPLSTEGNEATMPSVPKEFDQEKKEMAAEIAHFRKLGLRGVGMFAHVPGGSEEFARAKQKEIEREDKYRS